MLVCVAMFENPKLMAIKEKLKERLAQWESRFEALQDKAETRAGRVRVYLREKKLVRPLVLGILFVAGLLVGVGAKYMAEDTITIGHEDYRLLPAERLYDLNGLQDSALAQGSSLAVPERVVYPACKYE